MKFLMTMFQIQDYGGIINHAEYLAKGLQGLGHEVDFCMLVPKPRIIQRSRTPKDIEQYRKVGTGYFFHQARGWIDLPKIPYLSITERKKFKEKCSGYDAVLWHIPVPTLSKENKGVYEWLDLYDHGSKNIAIIHDGNLPELYPHLNYVAHHFHAAVCVHESALNSAKMLEIPYQMILNPFDLMGLEEGMDFDRRNGFAAIQVFKAWKRVDSLIRAIPYMENQEAKFVGGAGIEYRYMTSEEKCKPQYFTESGERIWDRALRHGMTYMGTVPNDVVYQTMRSVKLQVDPSYSKKYSRLGAHFNRTTIEAMIGGAVPLATDWGMIDSVLFIPDLNYIPIPAQCPPHIFAEIVDNALTDREQWLRIREDNLHLVKLFEMHKIAGQYVDLLTQKPEKFHIGQASAVDIQRCNKNLEFFGIAPSDTSRANPAPTGV